MNIVVLRKVLLALMPVFVEMVVLVLSEIRETSRNHNGQTEHTKEGANHETR